MLKIQYSSFKKKIEMLVKPLCFEVSMRLSHLQGRKWEIVVTHHAPKFTAIPVVP